MEPQFDLVASSRHKAKALEDAIINEGIQTIDIPIRHYFAHNLYAREMFLAEGTVLVGKIHKYSQINILSQGTVSVLTEKGLELLSAPHTFVGPPGAKRVFCALTDVTWTVIHATDETDVDKIEEIFIAPDEKSFIEFSRRLEVKP